MLPAYETIYFPAQRIHMDQDKPRENADLIFENDTYLAEKITHFDYKNEPNRALTLRGSR